MKEDCVTQDFMEKRLHSHTSALDNVVGSLIREFKAFKEQRQKWSEDLREEVKDTIQVTVNGKIDKIAVVVQEIKNQQQEIKDHLTRQDIKLDNLAKETEPIIESKNTIVNLRKFLLWVATPFTILWAMYEYIISKIR